MLESLRIPLSSDAHAQGSSCQRFLHRKDNQGNQQHLKQTQQSHLQYLPQEPTAAHLRAATIIDLLSCTEGEEQKASDENTRFTEYVTLPYVENPMNSQNIKKAHWK